MSKSYNHQHRQRGKEAQAYGGEYQEPKRRSHEKDHIKQQRKMKKVFREWSED